jgi:hypothetical protein
MLQGNVKGDNKTQYITTDGQFASLSRCQELIWGPLQNFYYSQRVAGLLM